MTTAPDILEERFLASLRERVSWQAHAAERLRAEAAGRAAPVDVLDLAALRRLVEASDHARTREWRAFLAELDLLGEPDGRLPSQLERLVRVVLEDLLV